VVNRGAPCARPRENQGQTLEGGTGEGGEEVTRAKWEGRSHGATERTGRERSKQTTPLCPVPDIVPVYGGDVLMYRGWCHACIHSHSHRVFASVHIKQRPSLQAAGKQQRHAAHPPCPLSYGGRSHRLARALSVPYHRVRRFGRRRGRRWSGGSHAGSERDGVECELAADRRGHAGQEGPAQEEDTKVQELGGMGRGAGSQDGRRR
jgi:hypothetical protein